MKQKKRCVSFSFFGGPSSPFAVPPIFFSVGPTKEVVRSRLLGHCIPGTFSFPTFRSFFHFCSMCCFLNFVRCGLFFPHHYSVPSKASAWSSSPLLHWSRSWLALLLRNRVRLLRLGHWRVGLWLPRSRGVRGTLLLHVGVGLLLLSVVRLLTVRRLLAGEPSDHRGLAVANSDGRHVVPNHHGLRQGCSDQHSAAAAVAAHGTDEHPEENSAADAEPQGPPCHAPRTTGAAGVVPVGTVP